MPEPSSFYLGPGKPRLQARTWQDVVSAAAAGVLDESQWMELKQSVPASGRPANLELARDLASLSIDGGVLVIGVADAAGAAGEVVGADLEGLQTRIGQVATGRVSPPLPVTLTAVTKPGQEGVGVLLVTVPASEGAPHMVDQKYWGRGSEGKRVLSDDEVRRLLADRASRAAGFDQRLRDLPARLDPTDLNPKGRLYVLLEPAAAAGEPVSHLLADLHPLQVVAPAVRFQPVWTPSWSSLNYLVPHPDGVAAASISLGDTSGKDQEFFFVLLADDGAVHVSSPAVRRYGYAPQDPDAEDVAVPGQLLETVHGAIAVAGHLASEHTGYQGPWRAGVLVTGLHGLLPAQALSDHFRGYSPYAGGEYLRTAQTTTEEMVGQASVVVERLLKDCLRGLGVQQRYLPYSDLKQIKQRT